MRTCGVVVRGQLDHVGTKRGIEAAFAQTNGMTAHAGMLVAQSDPDDFRRERIEAVERAERMQPAQRARLSPCLLFQQRHGFLVGFPDEHLLRHVALPAAGAVERCHQLGRRQLVEPRDRPRLRADRIDAINSAHVVPGTQIEPLLPVARDPLRVLDHVAIHVGDPQRPVRPRRQRRRPKPVVARGQELGLLLVGGAAAVERDAVRAR